MNSITKRWIRGSLLFTIALLIVAEGLLAAWTINTYKSSVRQSMMARMNTLNGQLSVTASLSEEERDEILLRTVTEFGETDKFELMLVDSNGRVVATSSGYMPSPQETMEDFEKANHSENGMGEFTGDMGQGERVMAITIFLDYPTENAVALRIVTSLDKVYDQINVTIFMSVLVVLLIILFSVTSGMFFVRSIVNPVGEIEETATKIAAGDFGVRVKEDYNDEIGKLGHTINHMAEELGKMEEMKNDFIASVSHELRTPLTSIKGWTETLAKMEDTTSPEYQKGIQIIQSETDRLYMMVEELLDFSRLQNGALTFDFEKIDIVAEVSDAVLMCTQRAALEKKELYYEEPDAIAAVKGDKNRLRQVFINILDNALKYTPQGGRIDVQITAKKQVQISFKDTGIGIEKDDLKQVQTKFFKGKNAVRGAGIGLAVVNQIINAHGGTLSIHSTKNKGTTVQVNLPLYEA